MVISMRNPGPLSFRCVSYSIQPGYLHFSFCYQLYIPICISAQGEVKAFRARDIMYSATEPVWAILHEW